MRLFKFNTKRFCGSVHGQTTICIKAHRCTFGLSVDFELGNLKKEIFIQLLFWRIVIYIFKVNTNQKD